MKQNITFYLFLIFLFQNHLLASEPSRIERAGDALVDGVIRANYREIPLDEILPLEQLAIPKIDRLQSVAHPALLLTRQDIPNIRQRQFRQPYADWADRIIRSADANPVDPSSPLMTELERSRFAKQSAFAYFLTGYDSYLDRAVAALSGITEIDPVHSLEGGSASSGWGDWMQAADALAQYAAAYDLVYAHLSPDQIAQTERKLAAQAEQIIRYLALIPKNNHAAAIGAGLGAFALVTRHPQAQMWLDSAMDQIRAALAKIEPDGSCREGAYYARFIASRLFPFFLYLNNATGVNLFAHRRVGRFVRWLSDIEKPDGSVPDFDDAFPEQLLFLPIGVGLFNESGEVRARFEDHPSRYDPSDPNWIDVFCGFDDRIIPNTPPYYSAAFYPHGGMAVFRNDSDLYGLFLGEPGRPFLSGHDHVEPLAFTLQAYGQDFLIDAGYGPGGVESGDRAWFVSGAAHNIPLINGQGPDSNPLVQDQSGGQIRDCFETGLISSSTVFAEYRASRLGRQIRFVDQRYFVVTDQIETDSQNRVTLPWHGLGDCEQERSGHVVWRSDRAALEAEFLHPGEPVFVSLQSGLHTLPENGGVHTTAQVTLPQETVRKMMTVFLPQKPGEDELRSEIWPVHSSDPAQARQIVSLKDGWADIVIAAENAWTCSGVASDARDAVFRSRAFEEEFFSGTELTCLEVNGETLFQSDRPVDLTLVFDSDGWYGFLDASGSGLPLRDSITVFLTLPADPGIILLDKKDIPFHWSDGRLSFSFQQGGILEMGRLSGRVRTDENIRDNLPVLTRLASLSDPEPVVQNLTQAEITQLRNEIVQAMGQSVIHEADQKLGSAGRTSGIYGVATGILNSVFNQTGRPGFNLPQQFSWTEKIGGNFVRYDEEGEFRDGRFTARRHSVFIDNQLRIMHENPFDSYHLTTVDLIHSDFAIQGTASQWKNDRSGQVRLSRMHGSRQTWLDFSSAMEEGRISGRLGSASKRWSGEAGLSRSHPDAPLIMRTQSAFRSVRYATTVRIQADKANGLTGFNWIQSWRLFRQMMINASMDKIWNQEKNSGRLSASLFWSRQSVYASLFSNWNDRSAPSGIWNSVFYRSKWRFESFGRYGPVLSGDFALARRSGKLSWETRILRGKRGAVQTLWHVSPAWIMQFRLSGSIRTIAFREKAFGLYYQQISRTGGEIRFTEENGESLTGITTMSGFNLNRQENLAIYTTGLWNRQGAWRAYEINLRQSGRCLTPGLLLFGDARGLIRCEGYLQWIF